MINYLPKFDTLLWSLKSREIYADIESLKAHVADQTTRICRYIGKDRFFLPHDVILTVLHDRDPFTGWKNFCSVVLDGNIIGYCGE